jgi:acyl-CoA ligase (AMP-forming) (exosortase A-associated)
MNALLLHELPLRVADAGPERIALRFDAAALTYDELAGGISRFAGALGAFGVHRSERVAIFLEKRFEFVIAAFGCSAAGAVFVPINPLLKAQQVFHILRDCNASVLVTSSERFAILRAASIDCPDLRHVLLVDDAVDASPTERFRVHAWSACRTAPSVAPRRQIDDDMVAILYTSGSTGGPKGVVLSHRNMVAGAQSVAHYLENTSEDVLLAALPLSFDAGFSQLTTAFNVGARVVLLNYLFPVDVVNAVVRERVTGLTAVPPLWIQLSGARWPSSTALRYFANTGGRMPRETLAALRRLFPSAKPYLMYGLTEAFRSTFLPPEEVDRRPDSIGKAIPNVEILVLRPDGTRCAAGEPGELVHRGALVGKGYWNDPAKTAERFRRLPGRPEGLMLEEIAVFSGDSVRMDEEGFLYFIGRNDELIKTSGYRVSPTEVEEAIYATKRVSECAAFGESHASLGQAIVAVVTPADGVTLDVGALLHDCRTSLPAYMVPVRIHVQTGGLPRNPNGKIDRKRLAAEFAALGQEGPR